MTIDWTETDVLAFHEQTQTTVELTADSEVTPSIKTAYKDMDHTSLIPI